MAAGGVLTLAEATGAGAEWVGRKAATLAELAAVGFDVPPGVVVTGEALEMSDDALRAALVAAMESAYARWPDRGEGPFAVRSSASAEDLEGASYAGLYETFLDVPAEGLVRAVRACHAAAHAGRVSAYQASRPAGDRRMRPSEPEMAVLVQPMVRAEASGVAFTANPVTGDRCETVVTAVTGPGERLVGGEAVGEEWVVRGVRAERRRSVERAIDGDQARAVADLAGRVHRHAGHPQDIEWAFAAGRLWLLQARPMTGLPEPVRWTPPGPGLWMRNFRLGEWLPEPMTPLFADWLLHLIEAGYLDGMRVTVGAVVPFRYASVNGWYYNALPRPSPRLLAKVIAQSRGRAVPFVYRALVQVSRNPVAADRAVLGRLERRWRTEILPEYRRLVDHLTAGVEDASPDDLVRTVDRVGRAAGEYLWYLAIVGGSAWKMEAALASFCRAHLAESLPDGPHVLLRGLPGAHPAIAGHAVHSIDWYHPTAGERPATPVPAGRGRHAELAAERLRATDACRGALGDRPGLLARFDALLDVTQRYAVTREEQARELTLGWPLLRRCARRLGEHLAGRGGLDDADDVFFLALPELTDTSRDHRGTVARRAAAWRRQRRLGPPLVLGTPPRLVGDPVQRAVDGSRRDAAIPDGAIVGHPASAGRATGRVRVVDGPEEFAQFEAGEIVVARATAPAWTPLFARAVAVVTDGGTLAAHASLIAREYGIPAVVGTGDATARLRTGQVVTVDGTAGFVVSE